MNYIVRTTDTSVELVGPFDTVEIAADYGASAEGRLWSGDPRWSCVGLPENFALKTEAPVDGVYVKGAYGRACNGGA